MRETGMFNGKAREETTAIPDLESPNAVQTCGLLQCRIHNPIRLWCVLILQYTTLRMQPARGCYVRETRALQCDILNPPSSCSVASQKVRIATISSAASVHIPSRDAWPHIPTKHRNCTCCKILPARRSPHVETDAQQLKSARAMQD
jgi:hypothetical protein